jgi:hypothetical protein
MERRPHLSNEQMAAGRGLTLAQRRALAQIERTAREERKRAAAERRASTSGLARYEARYRALLANVEAQRN